MAYQLHANLKSGYVQLTYSGTIDLAERTKAKAGVFATCFEHNLHRALVDLRSSDIRMSESEIVKFASSFKDKKQPEGYRLAAVIPPENQTENLVEIIISIDGIDVKYFYDFDEAIIWLTAI